MTSSGGGSELDDEELWERVEARRRARGLPPKERKAETQEERPKKRRPFLRGARKPAIAMFVLASLMLALDAYAIENSGVFFREAIALPIGLLPLAVATFLFPGRVDLPFFGRRKKESLAEVLEGTEPHERWIWLAAAVGGAIAGLYVAFSLDA